MAAINRERHPLWVPLSLCPERLMQNPFRAVLDRCQIGFFSWQKWLVTLASAVYVLSPLDAIPDVLGPLGSGDDLLVLYVLYRVWASPTLKAHA